MAEICDLVQYGYTASANMERVGPQYLRITDIAPEHIDWRSVPYCPIDEQHLGKYQLRDGDIVVARTGATVGYAKQIIDPPQAVFASYLVRFRVGPQFNRRYVGQLVQSDAYKRFVVAHASGAAQPNANAKVLGSFPIPIPPRTVQDKIAAILVTHDELIENNLRRIAILEEMSQSVYRKRLVGQRGFKQVAFGSLANEVKEGVDPQATEPTTPYVGLEHIPRKSFTLVQCGTADSTVSRKWRFVQGDVLFGRLRPYFHKVVVAPFDGVCSTDVIVIRPKARYDELIQQIAFSTEFVDYAVGTSGGTDRPRAKWGDLALFPVSMPPQDVLEIFASAVRPMIDLTMNLARQNANLRKTRDLLLPRLVSGDLDVSNLNLNTDWLVA